MIIELDENNKLIGNRFIDGLTSIAIITNIDDRYRLNFFIHLYDNGKEKTENTIFDVFDIDKGHITL